MRGLMLVLGLVAGLYGVFRPVIHQDRRLAIVEVAR
jgi:hypothetical protein